MDLRQLRFFTEIARTGNFTRAAERLRIAQPAMSVAIKRLEEELDLVLFNRQDKRVTLTAEGEVFLEHACGILNSVKVAELEMADLHGLNKGELRIGIPPMLSAYFSHQSSVILPGATPSCTCRSVVRGLGASSR